MQRRDETQAVAGRKTFCPQPVIRHTFGPSDKSQLSIDSLARQAPRWNPLFAGVVPCLSGDFRPHPIK